jgi:hypothetical protein
MQSVIDGDPDACNRSAIPDETFPAPRTLEKLLLNIVVLWRDSRENEGKNA